MKMLSVTYGKHLRGMVFFKKQMPEGYTLTIRPFFPDSHLSIIHKWTTSTHAHRFWQMQHYSKMQLGKHYDQLHSSGKAYSFVIYLEKKPVALIDSYHPIYDEVGNHYAVAANDQGIHLLMAPVIKRAPNLTVNVLSVFLEFMFRMSPTRFIGEPDIENEKANTLLKKVGFRFMKTITLSYKTANLYYYNKADFIKEHPTVY